MNRISVQLEPGNRYNSGSDVYLAINDGRRPQVAFKIEDYVRILGNFNLAAAEFAYFTSVIYACDRAIGRDVRGGDRWTRDFSVEIPVADPDKWNAAAGIAETMVEFLTGDLWQFDFVASPVALFGRDFRRKRRGFRKRTRVNGTAVALFSGGLDSLIGAIDWLEDNPSSNVVLASTYDSQAEKAKADQERLAPHLEAHYGSHFKRYVARAGLCTGGEDTNFRSRSLAFLGSAVLAASFIGNDTQIMIPENGAIALNFPLTPARKGSFSTRTVHPRFLELFGDFLAGLDLQYPLVNPYQFMTKGEMIQQCKNRTFLETVYSDSVSCGKRGFDRQHWSNKNAHGCGVCVPCIYRRAAILKAGFPEERYGYDLQASNTWSRDIRQPNSDLQAVIDFIETNHSSSKIWQTLKANGNLQATSKDQYVSLVQRLRDEVKVWCQAMRLI